MPGQRLDVFRPQRLGRQVPEAEFMQLVCNQTQHPQALRLGGVAPVTIVPAQGFQLVVEISHVHFASGKC